MAYVPKQTKFAVLLCDEFSPNAPLSYQRVVHDWLKSSRPDLEFTLDGFDVVKAQEYPSLDEGYSAVIISGSTSSAFQDEPWMTKLLLWIVRSVEIHKEVKLIGVCFGHQIIARALGGTCVRNKTWETGSTRITLTDIGQKIFQTSRDSPFVYVQAMHTDHVIELSEICLSLGSSALTPCLGFVVPYSNTSKIQTQSMSRDHYPSRPESQLRPPCISHLGSEIQILALQGHPEFTSSIVLYIIEMLEAKNILPPSLVQEARKNAVRGDDGCGIIGKAVWRVILGERSEINAPVDLSVSDLLVSRSNSNDTTGSSEEDSVSDSTEEQDRNELEPFVGIKPPPSFSRKARISSWTPPYHYLLSSILIFPFSFLCLWRWTELSRLICDSVQAVQ